MSDVIFPDAPALSAQIDPLAATAAETVILLEKFPTWHLDWRAKFSGAFIGTVVDPGV
jgi:hypothetical protein